MTVSQLPEYVARSTRLLDRRRREEGERRLMRAVAARVRVRRKKESLSGRKPGPAGTAGEAGGSAQHAGAGVPAEHARQRTPSPKIKTFTEAKQRQAIAEGPVDQVTRYLELRLGTRLTAYVVGLAPTHVAGLAAGSMTSDQGAERRIRNLYAVTWFVAHRDGPGAAYQFLVEPNAELNDRPPAEAMREGVAPREVWFAASAVY
jgi:hypothetical protein